MKNKARHRKSQAAFRVRQGTIDDLDTLVHQRRAMWKEMGVRSTKLLNTADSAYRQWAKTTLKAGTLHAWLVEDTKHHVVGGGCVWLQPVQPTPTHNGRDQPYLMSMYTEPEYRGRGVASLIVRETLEWSRQNKYPWVVLHASPKGRTLYKRLGFKRIWEMAFNITEKG